MDAEDLQIGDDVRNADGSTGNVEVIESEQTSQEMYNLTVDEAHTFFVGGGQWLVHNTCDFNRILYGSDEMSQAAQQFRLDLHMKGNNVAVFQVDGRLPYSLLDSVQSHPKFVRLEDDLLIARNLGDNGAHSEEVLYQMLTGYQVDPLREST